MRKNKITIIDCINLSNLIHAHIGNEYAVRKIDMTPKPIVTNVTCWFKCKQKQTLDELKMSEKFSQCDRYLRANNVGSTRLFIDGVNLKITITFSNKIDIGQIVKAVTEALR